MKHSTIFTSIICFALLTVLAFITPASLFLKTLLTLVCTVGIGFVIILVRYILDKKQEQSE